MALLELLQESIRTTADMASDAMESGKLKQRIRGEQKAIRGELKKLGEIYLALLEQAHPQQRRKLLVFLSAVTVFTMALCLLIALNASFLELRAPNAYFRFQDLLRWG